MRLTSHSTPRLAYAGAACLLVLITAFGFWSLDSAQEKIEQIRHRNAESDAYDAASDAVATEDFLVTEALVALHPEVRSKLPIARLREEHSEAAARLVGALEEIMRTGPDEEDTTLSRAILAQHERYLMLAAGLFAAAEAGDRARAFRIEYEQIDRLFEAMERRVRAAALAERAGALASERAVERSNGHAVAAVAAVWSLGVVLLGVLALIVRRSQRRLEHARRDELERARQAALTDALTGLRNRRAFEDDLGRELQRVSRSGSPVSLALLDLDGLKQINDTLGHEAGDERLRTLADCAVATLRGSDAVYRIGGDEYAILLAGERALGALRVVRRLHEHLVGRGQDGAPTFTAGIAEACELTPKDALFAQADLALIEAKRANRQAVVYSRELEREVARQDVRAEELHVKTLAAALARAVDAKDSYTRSHCETVAEVCALVAGRLGFERARISRLHLAGLLHDVGKIGIPDAILQKPGPLTSAEFDCMKTHVLLGHGVVASAELSEEALWILHHHERPDGNGYPDGLSGEEIPLESRIILVADAFEAMTADRAYRQGRSEREALEELEAHAGTQFDPECVAALRQAVSARDRGPNASEERAEAARLPATALTAKITQ